jgi:hypothetical protein
MMADWQQRRIASAAAQLVLAVVLAIAETRATSEILRTDEGGQTWVLVSSSP